MADDRDLRIKLGVDGADDAVDDLEAFADAAETVEKIDDVDVKVDATVDPGAVDDLEFLDRQLKELDGRKVTPTVAVNVDEAALRRVEAGLKGVDDAARHATSSAPSSAGALRDVGGAFGDVGTGALDAAEGLMGFGETLGQLSPKLQGVGEMLGKAGFVGAIAGLGLNLLVEGINSLNGSSATLEAGIGRVASSVNDGGVAFQKYADAAANSVSVGEILKSNVVGLGDTLQKVFGQKVADAGDRLKAFKKLLDESAPAAAALIAEMGGKIDTTELDKWARLLDDSQRNAAQVAAQSKNLEASQKLYNEAVEAGIDLTDKSADAIRRELSELKVRESVSHQTAVGIADDQDRIAKAMEAAAGAGAAANEKNREQVDKLRDSVDKLNDSLDEQHGAVLSEAESRVRLTDAQERYNDSLKEGKSSTDELTVAAIDVANAYADQLEQTKKANRETFTTEDRQAAVQASLQSTADKAKGPLKSALDQLVRDIDEIPANAHTDVTMNASQALAELNRVIRLAQIATQEIEIMKAVARGGAAAIAAPGVPGFSSSTTIVNVPPTLDPNRVLAAVDQGRRRNGALRRG